MFKYQIYKHNRLLKQKQQLNTKGTERHCILYTSLQSFQPLWKNIQKITAKKKYTEQKVDLNNPFAMNTGVN